ncbi:MULTISPECIES: S49 family peptidase [unclassified Sulfitobacter]|uniref:S49 family peptidase n=1 Tax=unclassified Sulfitobacter TaxID=196795 RepID=UPI0007C27BE4|nr:MULTISPECIES: S49 family peptidase [unclassified Sulfitobacter]KZX90398.1 peptidase S49 [Sulfitobacter sp. HI0021]KZY04224.1 peptidase S49 [Sulfitobacter sp. HI0027]KZZ01037.1 peptidase S49 [Sulfitobacter sp. HI0076]
MKGKTAGAFLQSNLMALSTTAGGALLAMDVPAAAQEPSATITIERGQRFAVQRGLAVVPVRGLLTPNMLAFERYMGWATYDGIEETMDELAADTEVSGVVLDMDSPGGMVRGIQAASDAIARCAAIKPVHVLVNPLAASAAYWLAAQATEIAMTAGAECGSIGVRLMASSPVEPDNWGDQWFELSSSKARAKNPDAASEAGMAELRRSLDASEAEFHAAVAAGRGIDPGALAARLSVTEDPQDGGAVFGAAEAIARGLADRQETRAQFYARVSEAYAPSVRPSNARAYAAKAQAAQATALT